MRDLSDLLTQIDHLSSEELELLYRHVSKRRVARYWLVAGDDIRRVQDIMADVQAQSAAMPQAAIDAAIDDALDEVRHARRAADSRD